jgi:hypothetical protein
VENHVTQLNSDTTTEISENHMTQLNSDATMENSENHATKISSDVCSAISEIKKHVTKYVQTQENANQIIRDKSLGKNPNMLNKIEIKEHVKCIKEALKLTLRPAPTGLVSEKYSARHQKFTHTSKFGNSLSTRKMPVHAFQNACTKVADFLIQNPGNFRFTTSIEDDTLTLSFFSSLPPSNDIPSPAYSPINWDELSVDLEESVPSDALDPQAPAASQTSHPQRLLYSGEHHLRLTQHAQHSHSHSGQCYPQSAQCVAYV